MKVIGITGGSGVGKTIVTEILSEKGIYVIDADIVSKQMVHKGSEYLNDIQKCFGKEILNEFEELDRKALADIIYNNKTKKALLDNITYKYIVPKVKEIINQNSKQDVIVIDAALLIESELYKDCDIVVAVVSDRENRIRRICNRDKISLEIAEKRINMQQLDEFYTNNADVIIYNNGYVEDLKKQVENKIL